MKTFNYIFIMSYKYLSSVTRHTISVASGQSSRTELKRQSFRIRMKTSKVN